MSTPQQSTPIELDFRDGVDRTSKERQFKAAHMYLKVKNELRAYGVDEDEAVAVARRCHDALLIALERREAAYEHSLAVAAERTATLMAEDVQDDELAP